MSLADTLSNAPLPLSPDDVREFRDMIASDNGVELSSQEAWNSATELVSLYRVLLGPIPEDPEGEAGDQEFKHPPTCPDSPDLLR